MSDRQHLIRKQLNEIRNSPEYRRLRSTKSDPSRLAALEKKVADLQSSLGSAPTVAPKKRAPSAPSAPTMVAPKARTPPARKNRAPKVAAPAVPAKRAQAKRAPAKRAPTVAAKKAAAAAEARVLSAMEPEQSLTESQVLDSVIDNIIEEETESTDVDDIEDLADIEDDLPEGRARGLAELEAELDDLDIEDDLE